jgi:7,8-dihydropterin-6-yl-methyl-4-(beta-D-ribofuranosyl)aminobenzene 5'-phosphate synthase
MKKTLQITVVYDNHPPNNPALKASWGFACVIEGFEKTVLFDTGTSGSILMNNLSVLGFEPRQIDAVIISHGDWDHLGGLWTFLDAHSEVEVYLPSSLSRHLKEEVQHTGATLIPVDATPLAVCPGITLSGEMIGPRKEQAILLQTEEERIIVTGCAHPGIVAITKRLAESSSLLPMLVMGGFHLKDTPEEEIKEIVQKMKTLGTQWVAPTHCTGEKAEELFKKEFKTACFSLCPGSKISKKELENKTT